MVDMDSSSRKIKKDDTQKFPIKKKKRRILK